MRGEYPTIKPHIILLLELPPRARRILMTERTFLMIFGTTSACAENTAVLIMKATFWGNYLRVRGEYSIADVRFLKASELPPRARRIRLKIFREGGSPGPTSACAENTATHHADRDPPRNYLRVRGEYYFYYLLVRLACELPPRARRIHTPRPNASRTIGTTSACAENTQEPPRGPAGH